MQVLRVIPAVLAAVLLGAHYLRGNDLLLVAASLLIAVFAIVPRRGTRLLARAFLAIGTLVWVNTAWRLVRMRMVEGVPYQRMVLILAGVALFTLLAAWLLPSPPRPREELTTETTPERS